MSAATEKSFMLRPLIWLMLPAIMLLAFAARTLVPYEPVINSPQQVQLLGTDSFFHLRQIRQIIDNFPHVPRQDNLSHYPTGYEDDASGLFGLSIAAATITLYGDTPTTDQIATVAAWFSPLFGMLIYVAVYWVAWLLFGHGGALFAAVSLLLYPGTMLDKSLLGFVDHHALETLLVVCALGGSISLWRSEAKPIWHPALLPALPVALLMMTWKGAIGAVGVLSLSWLGYWLLQMCKGTEPKVLIDPMVRFMLGLWCWLLPIELLQPTLSPLGYSLLGPLVIVTFLALVAYKFLHEITKLLQLAMNKAIPLAIIALITAAIVALGIFLLWNSGPVDSLLVAKDENLMEQQTVTLTRYFSSLGALGGLFLIAAVVGIWQSIKGKTEIILPVIFALLWVALWLLLADFGYNIPALMAIVCGVLAHRYTWLATPVVLAAPLYWLDKPWATLEKVQAAMVYHPHWQTAMTWLRTNTPSYDEEPRYGVMASWDFGNMIGAYGERVAVWSRYPSKQVPQWSMATSETQAMEALCPECQDDEQVRYVIADVWTCGPFYVAKQQKKGTIVELTKVGQVDLNGQTLPQLGYKPPRSQTFMSKLYANDGQGLKHHRLVYETPGQHYSTLLMRIIDLPNQQFDLQAMALPVNNPEDSKTYNEWSRHAVVNTPQGLLYDGKLAASIKIYEVVKGAVIMGKAAPDSVVEVSLTLKSKTTGRSFVYRQSTTADDSHYYKFVLPYPTTADPKHSDFIATGPYKMLIEGIDANEVTLTPEQVRQGQLIYY